MYKNFQTQVEKACQIAQFDKAFLASITKPQHLHEIHFDVKLSDGKTHNFQAFRVQHNNLAGPYKGGLRFAKELDLDEVKALGAWMTIKTALANLPLGGGKGGIKLDPKAYNFDDKALIMRKFVNAIQDNIGPDIDILAPDMYTNDRLMAIATDEMIKLKGNSYLGSFTGKPLHFGGIPGRQEATALGGIIVLEKHLQQQNKQLQGQKIVIQGFGNAGKHAAQILSSKGAIIVGVSDSQGGLYNSQGLELDQLVNCKAEGVAVGSCPANSQTAKRMTNPEILAADCDILILAALENVITQTNASQIKAPLIVELANGPITPAADAILSEQDCCVLPDILMNAGGVSVSYFEYVNNLSNAKTSQEEVYQKLEGLMIEAYDKVVSQKQKYSCTFREAAYIVALKRLESLYQLRKQFN